MRRIKRDTQYERLVQSLTSGDLAVFREIWRLLTFAALLGYRLKSKVPIGESDPGKAIQINYFENNPSFRGLLYLIGIIETDDTKCLQSGEEADELLLSLFEEYANGGLKYLSEVVGEGSDPFGRILGICMKLGVPEPSVPEVDFGLI